MSKIATRATIRLDKRNNIISTKYHYEHLTERMCEKLYDIEVAHRDYMKRKQLASIGIETIVPSVATAESNAKIKKDARMAELLKEMAALINA